MFSVDIKKCIGCALCIKDCFVNDIEMIDTHASIKNLNCFKCGHCIAICPVGAISTDEYNMSDVIEYEKKSFDINPENLLNFIKFRRTIRQFENKDIEKDKILKIIEAGRFTQTASNSQDTSYIVVQKNIQELKKLALESLNRMATQILDNSTSPLFRRYAKLWIQMYKNYIEDPNKEDRLFFNAPLIIVVVSDSQVNGALASSNMELMINSLGLGTVFSGFFTKASENNPDIKEFLGIAPEKQIVTCMVIGYPSIKYSRTVPRKSADISWR
ncbi:nitroreductase family protein [uncultured Cetobacterium sp.]|uniref:nitroreductase family protein n=1 Tax=uncultured Cetobacterium sp. TaxID=527638 RepID=UPI0026160215|nr:nitroreductase family protein [uncultured Cetobacterium sp.]